MACQHFVDKLPIVFQHVLRSLRAPYRGNMCRHYKQKLNKDHRHFVASEEHDNCVLCLVDDKGCMTYEEIGDYLGMSRKSISAIERSALDKLRASGLQAIDLSVHEIVSHYNNLAEEKTITVSSGKTYILN